MLWEAIKKFSVYESDPPKEGDDDPNKDPPGGGDPSKDPPKDPPESAKISVDALPDDLKELPEAEIKFHLAQMVAGLKTSSEKIGTLQEELRGAKAPVKEEPKEPDKPLEELILDDPEAAVMAVLKKAGLVERFDRMERDVGESAFTTVAAKVPGFEDHEDAVRTILKESNVLSTPDNILGALQMVVGRKTMEAEGREARAKLSTLIPKEPPDKDTVVHPKMSGLEKEIFDSSDMTEDQWFENKAGGFDIKVPTS